MKPANWYAHELAMRDKAHLILPPPRHLPSWAWPAVALLIALALLLK